MRALDEWAFQHLYWKIERSMEVEMLILQTLHPLSDLLPEWI